MARRTQLPGPAYNEQGEDDQHDYDDDYVGTLLAAPAGYGIVLANSNPCARSACHQILSPRSLPYVTNIATARLAVRRPRRVQMMWKSCEFAVQIPSVVT
jgi:hypothetical protein